MPFGRVRSAMKRALAVALVALAVLTSVVSASAEEPFTATMVGDYGNVTVMQVAGNYDELTPEGEANSLPRELIAQEFYATHTDDYDFLVIFSNFDFKFEPDAIAFYLGVKNDTLGIGAELYDNGHLFGSGGRLQGTIDMGNITKLASSPLDPRFDFTLDTLAHEMLHRWAARAKFRDSQGELSTALLGKNGSHWSYLLDSDGSLMYGNNWEDNGDGTFTSVAARKYFSPLDLYLMGMVDRSDVPPMLLIENPDIDPTKVSSGGDTISGTPRYITIDDIISAEGERVPGVQDAQKQFKMGFILATSGALTWDDLIGIEHIRKEFLSRFSILTDGQGLVEVVTTPKEDLPTNPGVEPVEPTPRALPPSMEDGVSWLLAVQNENGNWGGERTTERDTAVVVEVLENLSIPGQAQTGGLAWLVGREAGNADYLSAKIVAFAAAGQDVSSYVESLLALQNSDGGWGSKQSFLSTPVDTCAALQALSAAYSNSPAVGKGTDYLLARQNADGGWGYQETAESNVLVTAETSAVLQRLPMTNTLATALNRATDFLLKRQNVDGGFGSSPSTVYETALAYRALFGVLTDATVLGEASRYISRAQDGDGSWLQDPYSTTLAVEVMQLASTRPAPPEESTTAKLTGKVVDGASQQPLAGAKIVIQGDAALTTESAADGTFSLAEVPAGSQTVEVSLNGYATYAKAAELTAGSIVDLGTISLSPDTVTGIIRGKITDALTGNPLLGVSIALTGAHTWNGFTNDAGSFSIENVTLGEIILTASKAGYETIKGKGTVTGGSVLSFNAQMNPLPPLPTTGLVAGTVVDAATRQPLSGVAVALQSDPTIATRTDFTGQFILSEVPKGSQQVAFTLAGYAPAAIDVNVIADSVANLGTVTLSVNPPERAIRGTVTDAVTGLPISGATVAIGGAFSGTTVSGTDGGFAATGVDPGAVAVTAAKSGYSPLTVSGIVTEGELFLNPRLSPLPAQEPTGTLVGKIVDALTNEPLGGVTVSLQGDTSVIALSDASGAFSLANIPPGTQQVNFDLPGYATSSLTLDMLAGATVDAGSLPLAANPVTGTLKGLVTDADGGQPLSGVTVTVTGSYSGGVVTIETGSFELSQLPPGDVTVTASKPGYLEVTGAGTIVAGGVLIFNPQLAIIPPQPTTGMVTGKLVDATTLEPLSGVAVVVEGNPGIQLETDAAGSFQLVDLPAGPQDIRFSLAGYSSVSAQVEVVAGFIFDLGTLSLSSNPTTGVLKGTLTDAESGQPIEGATVTFSGASAGEALTASDGTFLFPDVVAGDIAISFSKAGYYPIAGDVPVVAGAVLFFDIQMTAIPSELTTASIMGRIVDGDTSQPLSGVTVTLRNDPLVTTSTDAAGGFTLSELPPVTLEIDFSMAGYADTAVRLDLQAGFVANLGTIPLYSNPSTGTVRGVITDAAAGQPLSGVTVTLSGAFQQVTTTAADGSYAFVGVSPGSVTTTVTKDGYYEVAATGEVAAGSVLFFNPQLVVAPPKSSTGILTGSVIDAMTRQPIAGAIVALEGRSSAGTDENGVFSLEGITPGAYPVIISAVGHVTVHYTAMISEGVTTDMHAIYLTPLLSETTVEGMVVNAQDGTPIKGAEVILVGTNLVDTTDLEGLYSISGINSLEFYLKASATGYDSLTKAISLTSSGYYSVDMPLNPSEESSLKLVGIRTEGQAYSAYSTVPVIAEVLNNSTQVINGTFSASITDTDGRVVDYLQATFIDGDGVEQDLFEFQPGVTTSVSLAWETLNHVPGAYQMVVKLTEGEAGISFGSRVVSEREAAITIDATEAVESLELTPMPRFANYGATEQIGIQASVVNRSNVPILLEVNYEWQNPDGFMVHAGSGTISILPVETTKSILLDTFEHTFVESGEFPIQVEVGSGPVPESIAGGSVNVAPGTRIEVEQGLTPTAIPPDGDQRLRMNIQLKGVVLK